MPDPEYIDPRDLRPGPIRHESLPPEQLEQIKAVYEVVGPYLDTTLEQFEIGFMRDAHPEREIAIWCCIAAAWLVYQENYEVAGEERELLAALIVISMGVRDVERLGVPFDIGRRLLDCYEGLEAT